MKKLYCLNWKRLIKTWYLSLPLLAVFACQIYLGVDMLLYVLNLGGGLSVNLMSMLNAEMGLIGLAFFLFASYEFIHKASDCGLQETVDSLDGASGKAFAAQLLVMGTAVLVYGLIGIGFQLMLMSAAPFTWAVFWNTLLSSLLYVLGPALVGFGIGSVAGIRVNRLPLYLFGLVAVFLTGTFSQFTVHVFSIQIWDTFGAAAGSIFLKIRGLFSNLQPIYNSVVDYAFAQGIEPFRWELLLFWLCLCAALALWLLKGRKKILSRILAGVLSAACIFSLIGYWNPGSHWQYITPVTMDIQSEEDGYYYKALGHVNEMEDKPAEFAVTAYDLHFSMWKQLSGDAVMTLDGTALPEYDFTLYHGYQVTGVTDGEGNPLEYERWNDYLRIKNPGEGALKTIHVSYSGYHANLYSTAQGAFLPGYFSYYPMEGLHSVYESPILSTGYEPAEEKQFTVKVDMPSTAFTNLERVEGNTFSGRTTALTLVAGMYEEEQIGDVVKIHPTYYQPTAGVDILEELQVQIQNFSQLTGLSVTMPEIKHIILPYNIDFPVPGAGAGNSVIVGDSLIFMYDTGNYNPYNQVIKDMLTKNYPDTAEKQYVKDTMDMMMTAVLDGDETLESVFVAQFGVDLPESYKWIDDYSESENNWREVQFYLYKALRGSDMKTLFAELERYLVDETNTTDQLTFAKSLAEKYPEEAQ